MHGNKRSASYRNIHKTGSSSWFFCIHRGCVNYFDSIFIKKENIMTTKKMNIYVSTKTTYLAEESSQKNQRFLWSYEITIKNDSEEIVQLLNRHWRITDMTGRVDEVRGAGVVGLQPIIKPGKEFVYSSFCQLSTPQGTMEGSYELQSLDEVRFLADIPKFILTSPSSITASYSSKLH
jgi:ApaG protein